MLTGRSSCAIQDCDSSERTRCRGVSTQGLWGIPRMQHCNGILLHDLAIWKNMKYCFKHHGYLTSVSQFMYVYVSFMFLQTQRFFCDVEIYGDLWVPSKASVEMAHQVLLLGLSKGRTLVKRRGMEEVIGSVSCLELMDAHGLVDLGAF